MFVVLGSAASLIALFYPFMGFALWKYIDGSPDKLTIVDYFIKFVISTIIVVPWLLVIGSISAILYTFVVKDDENKILLRVWGGVMLLLFLMFMYPYIHALFV